MASRYKSSKFNYKKKFTAAGFKRKSTISAKKKKSLYTEDWDKIRKQVYQRDGLRCVICGKKGKLHAHHIIPVKISKDNSMSNLVTLCSKCHRKLEEIGFSILERGGGLTEVRRTELTMIIEAKKERALAQVKKLEERKNEIGRSGSTTKNAKNVERNERHS